MIENESYSQQVNRRLSAARLLLRFVCSTERDISPLENKAVLESVLFQFYLSVLSYINECLDYNNEPIIDLENKSIFYNYETFVFQVNGLQALQKWNVENGNVLFGLFEYLSQMLTLEPQCVFNNGSNKNNADLVNTSDNKLKLIALSETKSSHEAVTVARDDFTVPDKIKYFIDVFQHFIDAERNANAEY